MVGLFNSCYILIFQIEKIFCPEKLLTVIICILYVKVVFIVVFIAYMCCNSFMLYNVWDCFLISSPSFDFMTLCKLIYRYTDYYSCE